MNKSIFKVANGFGVNLFLECANLMNKQQPEKYGQVMLILTATVLLMGSFRMLSSENTFTVPVRPNIIVILADDMGYSDLGCMGSEISTPNLDQLAANGLLMTQFYNAGRCCPTRASLLTGLYQHQAGVGDMTENRGVPAYQGYLNKQCVTMAEVLKQAGYTTAMTGKWHVGERPEHWPQRRGFTHFYGIPQGGGAYFYPFLVNRQVWENDRQVTPDSNTFYSTDAFSVYAAQFIEKQKNSPSPYFLYVAYVAPHFPLQAKAEDIRRYRGKYKAGFEAIRKQRFERMKALGILSPSVSLSPTNESVKNWASLTEAEKDTLDFKMAVYAAQTESIDRGIGKIVQTLKETQQLDNTLIVFLSDNGGESAHAYPVRGATGPIGSARSWTSYGASWANVSNTPFRLYKSQTYEGGIITPLIAHYPKMIGKKQISRQPGHVVDLMPTLLELAGAKYLSTYQGNTLLPLPGESLTGVFKGNKTLPQRNLYWEHEGNRAVRSGEWKLVSRYPENRWSLYDLANDPTELNDLSKQYPDKVKKLEKQYEAWAARTGVIPWREVVRR